MTFSKWIRQLSALLLVAAISTVTWAQDDALYGKSDPTGKSGGKLTIGSLTEPPSLDPYHQGADARIRVTVLSYQGLFYEGASGEAVPLLAQSYTQSADGLTYTFKLRQGVKFHTGQTMTAADVKYSYDYLRDSKNGSPGAGDLSTVASISAPDDDTVIFTLSSRNGLLPMTLTHRYGGVIPKDYFATPDAKAKLNQVSVGTGPFKLKQFRQNSVLVFEKFKDYWQKGLPHLDEVTFAFMPNSAAMAVAATNGRIDMAIFTRPQDTEQLTKVKGLKLIRTYGQVIGTMVAGMQARWGLPIDQTPNQKVDLDTARKLLAEAGYPNGFELDLTTIITYDWMDPAAITIAEQLKKIGIRVNIKKLELGVWVRNFQNKQMGFTFNDWPASPDPSLLYYRHFRAAPLGADFRNWKNEQASALLDQGREESDYAKRREIYNNFQKQLAQSVPTIMMFSADLLTVEGARVQNHQQHPTGWYFGLIKTWVPN